MRKDKEIATRSYDNLLERIAGILNQARTKIIREINRAQVLAYWEIGREMNELKELWRVTRSRHNDLEKELVSNYINLLREIIPGFENEVS